MDGCVAAPWSSTAADLDSDGTSTTVFPRDGGEHTIASIADRPGLLPNVTLLTVGERELRVGAAAAVVASSRGCGCRC